VFDRAFERLLELLGVGLPSPLVQQTRAKLGLEAFLANLTTIDQPKEDAVGDDRLEQIGEVERQRISPFARFVQIADCRIERCCPNR
jgi:hypothetical protein